MNQSEDAKELSIKENVEERFWKLIADGHNTRSAKRKIKKEYGYNVFIFHGIL